MIATCVNNNGDTVSYLYQWDINQKIYVEYEEIDEDIIPVFHFFNKYSTEAITVEAQSDFLDDTMIYAIIPNELLQVSATLIVCVYYKELDNFGNKRTAVVLKLPVRKRDKPDTYDDDLGSSTTPSEEEVVEDLTEPEVQAIFD